MNGTPPTPSPPPPEQPSLLLTPAEVARELRLSVRKVRAMKAAGQIPPPVRFGRSVRWRRGDLEAWVAKLKASAI